MEHGAKLQSTLHVDAISAVVLVWNKRFSRWMLVSVSWDRSLVGWFIKAPRQEEAVNLDDDDEDALSPCASPMPTRRNSPTAPQ